MYYLFQWLGFRVAKLPQKSSIRYFDFDDDMYLGKVNDSRNETANRCVLGLLGIAI